MVPLGQQPCVQLGLQRVVQHGREGFRCKMLKSLSGSVLEGGQGEKQVALTEVCKVGQMGWTA